MTTTDNPTPSRLAFVAGATGYVGGQVIMALTDAGWRVRALTRSPESARDTVWADRIVQGDAMPGRVSLVVGDAESPATLRHGMADVDVAWYLLHSMGEDGDFREAERRTAHAFADAAAASDVSRIVYLGGLHPQGEELSDHLASRVEVGEILLASGVPTAVLQAGVVIGDESASFVMLRNLAERLPGSIGPAWLQNEIQPIAVEDAVHYLVAAADLPADVSRTFDIGGPDVVSYAGMMKRYAKVMGLGPRIVATAPVTTPKAASMWIGLTTPITSKLAEPLIGSLLHDTVMHEDDLTALVGEPAGGRAGFDEAVRRATRHIDTRRWLKTATATSAAVVACAVAGSLFSDPTSRWYERLDKPSIQPPGWVFPVVWTALYADIAAVSSLTIADLAETDREDDRRAFIAALALNLVLNASWSGVFFKAHRLRTSTVGAALLAASSVDLVRRAGTVSREKAVVLSPYAAWTAFAAVLSGAIERRNR